jgi:sulfate-transporting ATPase
MSTFTQYALLGLGAGAAYTLLAQGMVVIQIGSGVVNFAHGAMAMAGGFTFYSLHQTHHWSFAPAFVASVLLVAGIGVAVHLLVMRPLRAASALARVVATLGVLLLLEGIFLLEFTEAPKFLPAFLPAHLVDLGGVYLGEDRFIMVGIAVTLTAALWAIARFTRLGLAIRGAAESERAAATLGWSTDQLAALTWAVGGALAGTAGILLSPLTSLQVADMSLLVIPVLAAALAGGFSSFWLTLAGSMVIGMGQALLANYLPNVQGISTAFPFAVITLFLVIRGKSLPIRGATSTFRLPELGTGRVRWGWLVSILAVFIALVWTVFPVQLVDSLTVSLAWGIILLSIVVLMGYAGQVDLAPLAWGGMAALIAARLVRDLDVPFEIAILVGMLGAIPVGLCFGIPALRARGLNLAVVTLGLGLMVHDMVFANIAITESPQGTGTNVGSQSLFGIDIGAFQHPQRYLMVVLAFFVGFALLITNVRRGRIGRRLIAVRTNEEAAAALGISVFGSKLYAFAFSASLAAVGGILIGFHYETISFYDTYDPLSSMLAATHAVLGGVGFVVGAVFGSQFATGGVGNWALHETFPHAGAVWLTIIGAAGVLILLVQDPNGLVSMNIKAAQAAEGQSKLAWLRLEVIILRGWAMLRRTLFHATPKRPPTTVELPTVTHEMIKLAPELLRIVDLTVRYGAVTAVDSVSLEVRPGEVVGLIGPNGAGKTSMIDAVTGFARPAAGEVWLGDRRIDTWPVHKRARAGVCRSFQNLQLFEASTVLENLRVASDRRDARAYLSDLVAPEKTSLAPLTVVAIREFALESDLLKRPSQLSYGARRLLAIARTIAVGPSVLLLDEPVAGLSTRESQELVHVLRRLAREWGLGILLIEHDMSFVMQLCDRILVLDFGKPIASGTPNEVREDPAVIAAYLGEPDVAVAAG